MWIEQTELNLRFIYSVTIDFVKEYSPVLRRANFFLVSELAPPWRAPILKMKRSRQLTSA